MNPCPCGYYAGPVQECTCSNAMVSLSWPKTVVRSRISPSSQNHSFG
ncbi:MAG: ATP-binding protein [Anaerolineae bacterium]